MTNAEIGDRIKYARDLRNATLDDIAKKVGVTKSTVQRYENGKINTIKIPVVESIAMALNVNPSWIVGKSDMMELPTQKVPKIIEYYKLLNDTGKHEATKRVKELTELSQYTKSDNDFSTEFSTEIVLIKEHLIPNAAHHRTDIDTSDISEDVDDKYFDE